MSKERLFKELPSHKSNRKQDVCVLWARAGVLPVPFHASLIVITVQAGSCDTNSYNYAIMREACENQLCLPLRGLSRGCTYALRNVTPHLYNC